MRNFWAVFKREIKIYFTSPIAYAIIVIFLLISGFFFFSTLSYYSLMSFQAAQNPYMAQLNIGSMVLAPLFSNISIIMLLMLPALTMRLFSEEKKSGTYELLFTYPIRDVEVLLGKYAAALTVFIVMTGLTASYLLLLLALGKSAPGVALSGYLGLLLMGAAFISLGVLISAMTENQIVAAVVSFGFILLLWLVGWADSLVGPEVGQVLAHLSLIKHFSNFAKGVLDTADLVYYACFIFFFLFVCLRVLESKRWRG